MTHDEVTAAMKAEDMPAELVEAAVRALVDQAAAEAPHLPVEAIAKAGKANLDFTARVILAAVLPEIQAQALEEAADVFEWARDDADYAAFQGWLRDRAIEKRAAARLAATTEEAR